MTDDELLARAKLIMRRILFRPPDPDRVSEWAYKVCCENLISERQLYDWLVDQGESMSEAYRLIFGPPPHEVYGDDWKSLAAYMSERFEWTLEEIANYIQGWHGSQNISTVRRALDPDARAKQAEHSRAYRRRHPDKIKEANRQYWLENRERILAKRRANRKTNPPRE